ncbi:MAG: LapA family protein [Gammaproteobacteria bacterium]|jgi:putative membrane protein
MKRIIYLILTLVVTLFTVTFTLLNSQPVKVNYYFGSYEIDLLIVVVICLVIGAFLGIMAALGKMFSLKQEMSRKEKKIKITEKELENLRSLPLKDEH